MGKARENVRRNLGYFLTLRGMNQKELAERLNVSPSAVTNWIRGKNAPDIELVAEICDVLNVSTSDLFGKNDEALTLLEQRVLAGYRAKPELQHAVNILLDVDVPTEEGGTA